MEAYAARRSKDFPLFLVVWCQYEDCPSASADRPFLVSEREWLRPMRRKKKSTGGTYTIVGRSCPYCFRTGRVPKRSEIK
jgi:hypothetical protein